MKTFAQVAAIPVNEEYIGTGDAAIYNTVDKMKEIINNSSKNPYIREWASSIIAGVPVNDRKGEANAIFSFVNSNVRYTRDPYGFEYIQTPPVMLEDIKNFRASKGDRPAGDCDDMTVLSLSLLKSIGFRVAIKVVSFVESKQFGHVYGLVNLGYQWVPFDCIRPGAHMGWEAPGATRAMETIV